MARAVRIHTLGGPEVLQVEEIEVGAPKAGEARIRQTAIGVNFVDTYERSGLYPIDIPFIPGSEAVGIVEAVGDGVAPLKPGDRVAYASVRGAYCSERLIAADRLVALPDSIEDRIAAAAMLKGLTAEYLLRRTFPVKPGHFVLFHAAAGGVGQIACQWAKALGGTVIGTVGSEAKAEIARAHGCDHVVNYETEDFVERVREITEGRGVDVVYDGVGEATFPASLDALKRRGMWVSFGQSSGKVPDFSPLLLATKGSLFMSRPRLADYVAERTELESAAAALFAAIASGEVEMSDIGSFPLTEAAEAHRALEGRRTTGSTILTP